jgi:hypothetical protein
MEDSETEVKELELRCENLQAAVLLAPERIKDDLKYELSFTKAKLNRLRDKVKKEAGH